MTQITADGIGQLFMMAIAVIGIVLAIDTYQFIATDSDFLSSMSIVVNIDDRARALVQAILALSLFFFGIGRWTAQVGGIAIFMVLFLASGHYWSLEEGKGAANTQQVTRAADSDDSDSSTTKECKLTESMKLWCRQDTDGDGVINRLDPDFSDGEGSGRANCRNGYYMPRQGEACQ